MTATGSTAQCPSVAPVGGCGLRAPLPQGLLRFALGFIPSPLRGWNQVEKATLRCIAILAISVVMIVCAADAWGQTNQRRPHIGYLYPAGGQQGSVFEIIVGGQFLKGVTDVHVSGEGVRASVVQHYRPLRNLTKEQRKEIQRRLRELGEKRWAELHKQGLVGPKPPWPKGGGNASMADKENAEETESVELPEHLLLRNLEDKSLRELQHVRNTFFKLGKRQRNAQISESLLIEVTIDPDAAMGDRELRLAGRQGLTNPMVFQVGVLPEARELESNDPMVNDPLPKEPPVDLPILMNGQIMPGDVDRFRFSASRGQQLVIEAQARRLIPYLADAVPGWFQATLALYDAEGDEVAFADDYRFDPDPVIFYEIPDDGEYELEIRDSIYRGREDFVYRVAVGERPFITRMFPLGGREGDKTVASIDGWNLGKKRLSLDTRPGAGDIRQTALRQGKRLSNRVTYAVGTLPECDDIEPNDTTKNAQRITLPLTINGRIARPGDVDVFWFKGKAGDDVVAEVMGRSLRSPLDSLLRLIDASGRVLEWNDDKEDRDGYLHRDPGLLTHHADSSLRAELPADGTWYVQLSDSRTHGGDAYGYRLRIGPPRPDFALRVTPSSVNVPVGRAAPIRVHVLRKDGFDGEIELILKNAPDGFTLSGARIPAGRNSIRMTLTAPRERLNEPAALTLEGRAEIGGKTIRRPVVPSEDMMQAFLYRHLVPSREFMVAVTRGKRGGRPVELVGDVPVQIPAGGATEVRIRIPKRPKLRKIELELSDPPTGMSLQDVTVVPDGLAFQLRVDGDALQVGFADNLIVEAFTEVVREAKGDKKAKRRQRISLGVLPAIPFEIVP